MLILLLNDGSNVVHDAENKPGGATETPILAS